MLVEPPEDAKAVLSGHLQIEQQQPGKAVEAAVGELAFTGQVVNGALTVRDHMYWILNPGFPKRRSVISQFERAKAEAVAGSQGFALRPN